MNKRDGDRATKYARARRYGLDVQAALLTYRLGIDPFVAHQIAENFFEPSVEEQEQTYIRVWQYLQYGFRPEDIVTWWTAGIQANGHLWYKAGYTPSQTHWARREMESLTIEPDIQSESESESESESDSDSGDTTDARHRFISNLLRAQHPVEHVITALRAGPSSSTVLETWLRKARTDPAKLESLRILAAVGDKSGPA